MGVGLGAARWEARAAPHAAGTPQCCICACSMQHARQQALQRKRARGPRAGPFGDEPPSSVRTHPTHAALCCALPAGSWVELEVDTRQLPGQAPRGGSSLAGPSGAQAAVLVGHLRSYVGMGTAAVECRSGCSCRPSILDGTSASRVSVFKIHSFKVCGPHRVQMPELLDARTASASRVCPHSPRYQPPGRTQACSVPRWLPWACPAGLPAQAVPLPSDSFEGTGVHTPGGPQGHASRCHGDTHFTGGAMSGD